MTYELKKLKNFLGEELYNILKKYECFIAGGFIRNIFTNSEVNDIDIYFRNKSSIEQLLMDEFRSNYLFCVTKKAITIEYEKKTLQLIFIDYYQDADSIFGSFDFTCCMGAFDFKEERFIFYKDFMKHNAQRVLKFNSKTLFPIISALRINKYLEKGYQISRKSVIEIMLSINALKIDSLEELTSQLGGMYGENVDDIFSESLKENFDINKALKELQEKEFIYKEIENVDFGNSGSYELFIKETLNDEIKYFEYQNKSYIKCGSEIVEIKEIKDNYIKCDMNEILTFPMIKYKIVKKQDNRYFSYYDNSFEYFLNKEAIPKNIHSGLYISDKEKLVSNTYYQNEDKAILKCLIESADDFYNITNQGQVKRLIVIGEEERSDEDESSNISR